MPLLLGIDTGGTFTDAALIDAATGGVVAAAKSPTTHHDLVIGVAGAIDAVLAAQPDCAQHIGLVAVSTTLATNALVESTGSPACLITLGFSESELDNAGVVSGLAPGDDLIVLPGGHDAHGAEQLPLEDVVASVKRAVGAAGHRFDGYAIASQFSVRNPAHEVAAADAVRAATNRPVTRSHTLSPRLGGPRRALTALLNARLVGLITGLVAAVEQAKADRDITAPTMVVRGDGSLVGADFATDRPIETILSGPAASVVGAMHLADERDTLVADVGGTTTDVCVVRAGRPATAPDGATVAGHRTMVEAVDMLTIGLGGDSEVSVGGLERADNERPLSVGPQRAVPIGRLARTHGAVVKSVLARAEVATNLSAPDLRMLVATGIGDTPTDLDAREQAVLDAVVGGPQAEREVIDSALKRRALDRLRSRGLIRIATITPTDAASVLGLVSEDDGQLSAEVSERALDAFARLQGPAGAAIAADAGELATAIVTELEQRTAEFVLSAALHADGLGGVDPRTDQVVAAALRARRHNNDEASALRLDVGLGLPIIAIGASAGSFYPGVGDLLGTAAITPPHAAVANAVGAAVADVVVRSELTVTQPRKGQFRVHGVRPETFATVEAAIDHATVTLTALLTQTALEAGGAEPELVTDWTPTVAIVGGREVFVEGRMSGEARARPKLGS